MKDSELKLFQNVAKKSPKFEILYRELVTSLPEKEARFLKEYVEGLAKGKSKDNSDGSVYISPGENLDARLTVVKTNIYLGDIDSACLGLVGALEERVDQLQKERSEWGSDHYLKLFLKHFGVGKLSDESEVKQLYNRYEELMRRV